MKKHSREVNVFSMSALDLFASALGAFILISIVLMPFYLNVDPDEVDRLNQENAQLRRQLQDLINTPKFQFPELDMVIALDTTGSMREQVDGLRSEIVQLTHLLRKLSPAVAIGVIDFKDRCEGADAVREFGLRRMDSAGLDALARFTRTMRAGGSGCNSDSPEALAAALNTAIASRWRTESEARVIVIITDNPAYEEKQAQALGAASSFASARGSQSKVSVVLRGNDVPFLRRLAASGNGEYIQAGASFTAAIVLALAE